MKRQRKQFAMKCQIFCMKCLSLFSGKKTKTITKSHLLNFLPSTLVIALNLAPFSERGLCNCAGKETENWCNTPQPLYNTIVGVHIINRVS